MRGASVRVSGLPGWFVAGAALALAGCGQDPGSLSRSGFQPAAPQADGVICCSQKPPAVPESEARPTQDRNTAIKLAVVKYEALGQAIQAQRGRIVVVDIWGDFCIPCKREFPNLVKLYQRHARDGVVCMSVSVDPVERRDAALAFLKSQGAIFPNFLLDEDAAVWQANWDLSSVPAVLVFYRDGTRAGKFDDNDPDHPFSYADVEKLVEWLLRTDE